MVTIQSVCGGGSKGLYNASRCALWKINSSSMFANLSLSHMPTHTHHTHTRLQICLVHTLAVFWRQCVPTNEWKVSLQRNIFGMASPPVFVACNTGSASNARCKGLAAMARFFVSGLQSLAYMCTLMVVNLWVVRIQNLSIYLVLRPIISSFHVAWVQG